MPYVYTYPSEPFRLPPSLDPHHQRWLLWAVTVTVAAGIAVGIVNPAVWPGTPSSSVSFRGR